MKTFSTSIAGGNINEDAIWVGEHLQLVVDGASGLSPEQSAESTEASRLAQAICKAIPELEQIQLSNLPLELQSHLRPRFPAGFSASAAIAAVSVTQQYVQFMLLGDCTIILETRHGGIHVYHDNCVTNLDSAVLSEAVASSRRMGVTLSEVKDRLLPILRKNRALLNEPNGYAAFDMQHDLTDKAILYSFPRQTVKRYIIMSDGWEALMSTYGIVPSPAAMIELCFKPNALAILSQAMRTVSDLDPDWRVYPRLKQLDDYSCIAVEI